MEKAGSGARAAWEEAARVSCAADGPQRLADMVSDPGARRRQTGRGAALQTGAGDWGLAGRKGGAEGGGKVRGPDHCLWPL